MTWELSDFQPKRKPLKRTRLKQRKKVRKETKVYSNGRKVLSDAEYQAEMFRPGGLYERDQAICHLCGKYVRPEEATRDHVRPRGMGGGFRDDSQMRLAHGLCNGARGSRRLAGLRTGDGG